MKVENSKMVWTSVGSDNNSLELRKKVEEYDAAWAEWEKEHPVDKKVEEEVNRICDEVEKEVFGADIQTNKKRVLKRS